MFPDSNSEAIEPDRSEPETGTALPADPTTQLLRAELARYGGELAADAPEVLVGLWAGRLKGATHDRIAEMVAEWLDEPEVAVWARNYRRPAPLSALSPLRTVLQRHGDELLSGASEALARAWGAELNGDSAPRLAGEVARRLAAPENARYRRIPGAPDPPEVVVHTMIARFAHLLVPGAVDELTWRWAPELAQYLEPHQLAEAIMQRLTSPALRGFLRPGQSMPRTGQETLKVVLTHREDLRPRAADVLFATWGPVMNHLPPPRVAGLVEQWLALPGCEGYLRKTV